MRPPVRPHGVPSHGARDQGRLRPGRLRARGERPRLAARPKRRPAAHGRAGAATGSAGVPVARGRATGPDHGGERTPAAPRRREPRAARRGRRGDDLPLAPRLRPGRRPALVPGGERVAGVRALDRCGDDRPLAGAGHTASAREHGRGGGSQPASPALAATGEDGATLVSNTSKPRRARQDGGPVVRPSPPAPPPAPPAEPEPTRSAPVPTFPVPTSPPDDRVPGPSLPGGGGGEPEQPDLPGSGAGTRG